jgi:D-glycero-alpha-D-manno-heptose-7-phosphate kinase
MIVSRTPFRVSFLGGGTDYRAWYREHGGAVLATTIDKYCYISVRELPPFFDHSFRVVYSVVENVKHVGDIQHPSVRAVLQHLHITRGLEIHHDGDLPARSGLGSSSAFTVGLLAAMHAMAGRYVTKEALADEAIHVEHEVIAEPVGTQDQVSAAFGGFNHIVFRPDDTYEVRPLILPEPRIRALQEHLMLVFTGISRTAADIAKAQIDNVKARTSELADLASLVDAGINVLSSPATELAEFGRLLGESWAIKRRLASAVSNSTVDGLYDAACKAGAIGGKLLGAGGGGFLLLFVRPEDQPQVAESLRHLIRVPVRFDVSGSRIVLYQPDGL